MTRSIAAFDLLASVPEFVTVSFAFVTLLGDAAVLFAALSLLYWIGPRYVPHSRRTALAVVGIAVAGLAVTLTVKSLVAAPRPPSSPDVPVWLPEPFAAVVANELAQSGFGFPSGHTVSSAVFYGGLAAFLRVWDVRTRFLLAGGIIGAVGASRVFLHVHYVVDVLVGAVLGLALVAIVVYTGRDSDGRPLPDRAFAIGGSIAIVGLLVATWFDHPREVTQAGVAIGTAIGGIFGWRSYGPAALEAPPMGAGASLLALAIAGALWVSAYEVPLAVPVTILLSAIATAFIVAAPLLADRVREPFGSE
ncbi:MAG: phosphatase PAP2 family protein [Halobacteriota archaeon]